MYITIQCHVSSRDKGTHLLCSLLDLQHLEGSLAHSRYAINIYQVNETIVDFLFKILLIGCLGGSVG